MMTDELIIIEKTGQIALLTLNRPEKRNAMNGRLIAEFLIAIKQLAVDPSIRVVIIHGNGEHFCAGGDIHWMHAVTSDSDLKNQADAHVLADLLYQLYHFPRPIIGLAHGATMGGGIGILSVCDIVIASKMAHFAFSEVKLGLTPSTISPYVIAAIGARRAQYYFLTGDVFHADEAYNIGLVHQLTEEKALFSTAATIAKRLLLNGPNALTTVKSLIRQLANEKITPILSEQSAMHLAQLRASPEAQEGLKAFMEKRIPKWS